MGWIAPYIPIILEIILIIGIVFVGFKLYKKIRLSKK